VKGDSRYPRPAAGQYASWPPAYDADALLARLPWAVVTGGASRARVQVRTATREGALHFAEVGWAGGRAYYLPGVPGTTVDLTEALALVASEIAHA
jgi:hypothetical protein